MEEDTLASASASCRASVNDDECGKYVLNSPFSCLGTYCAKAKEERPIACVL